MDKPAILRALAGLDMKGLDVSVEAEETPSGRVRHEIRVFFGRQEGTLAWHLACAIRDRLMAAGAEELPSPHGHHPGGALASSYRLSVG